MSLTCEICKQKYEAGHICYAPSPRERIEDLESELAISEAAREDLKNPPSYWADRCSMTERKLFVAEAAREHDIRVLANQALELERLQGIEARAEADVSNAEAALRKITKSPTAVGKDIARDYFAEKEKG